MRLLKISLGYLYRGMIYCYPKLIREQFGEEMIGVFTEANERACQQGFKAVFGFIIRELIDWPYALLHACIDVIKIQYHRLRRDSDAGVLMIGQPVESEIEMFVQGRLPKTNKRKSVLISLPLALLGLGIMLSALIRTDVWYRLPAWQLYLSVGVLLLPGVFVAAIALLAIIKRIPDWGLTWVGCAFMGFTLSFQVAVSEFAEEGMLSIPPAIEVILGLTFFLAGLTLLLLVATRGWARAGLFTMAVAGTMGLSLFQALTAAPFNRDDVAIFAGPLGFIFALLMYLYIGWDPGKRWLILSGFVLVNTAVVFISTNTLRPWFESSGAADPVLPLLVIITGLLLSGPLSGVLLRQLVDRKV